MKILYLSRWFPSPIDNGAKMRLFHLIKGLAEFHTVDFQYPFAPSRQTPYSCSLWRPSAGGSMLFILFI